jgi:RNA polymerase sigma-70 factor (ECF subfamily)
MSEILLARARKGDKDAFGQLIYPYERLLYNIAYKYMGNVEDASDTVQEAMLKIYLNIKSCGSFGSFKAWSAKITVNTSLDALRKRARASAGTLEEHQAPETDEPEHTVIHKEEVRRVKNAINALREDQRTLIILRDLEGFSYEELAEATGAALGTVKSRLSRARQALREQIDKSGRL